MVYFEINFLDKYVNTLTYIVDRMKPFIAIDVIFFEAKIWHIFFMKLFDYYFEHHALKEISQLTFTCSKSTIETLAKVLVTSFWCFYC